MFSLAIFTNSALLAYITAATLSSYQGKDRLVNEVPKTLDRWHQVFYILGIFCLSGIVIEASKGYGSWAIPLLVFCLATVGLLIRFKSRLALISVTCSALVSVILMLQIFSSRSPVGMHFSKALADSFLTFHVTVSVIGQAFSIIACLFAVLLLRQQANLREKRLRAFNQGPGLERVDRLLTATLYLGLCAYSISLFSGALIAQTLELGSQFSLGWKTLWAISVWLFYLILIHGRASGFLVRRQIALLSFLGFVILLVAFFGTSFFLRGGA